MLRFVVAIALCFAFPAAGWARDTLRIGMTQFPSTLHPSIDSMLAKTYVHGMTLRPITGFDHDWEVACFLCTEVPSFENGRAERVERDDGSVGVRVRYDLHPDARWGDGVPVTTDDILFAWRFGTHPASTVPAREAYTDVLDIEVHGPKSFTLDLKDLTYRYNAANVLRPLPAHLEAEIFEASPETYRNRTLYDTDPTEPGLWMGPYRIAEVATGQYVVLERNPEWFGEEPYFERIVIEVVENTPALEARLLAGEIDMIPGEGGLPIDQAIAFAERGDDRFRVVYEPSLFYEHLEANLDNPIFQDVRVRQALLHAVDREALSERLFAGEQPVAATSVHPLDWTHADDLEPHPFNVELARELLDEAGWTVGPGGVRTNAAGDRLSFELSTTAGNRTRELVQQYLQAQWAAIGVEAVIRNLPPRVLFAEHLSRRQFPGMAMFAWVSTPEHLPQTTLHSTMIPSAENSWSGQNYAGYANPQMDALIDAIEVELDREARAELWRRFQELYATDLPALPLFFRANAHIWPTWLEGVRPTGHQDISTLWVEEWRPKD